MSVVIGLVGRICCGQETYANFLKEIDPKTQIKTLKGFDYQEIFNNVLEIQDASKRKEYLKQEAKKIQDYEKDNEKVCRQAYLDWIILNEDSSVIDTRPQVLFPFTSTPNFDFMLKRNYFYLVIIETPVIDRYQYFLKKYPEFQEKVDLPLFCLVDDMLFFYSQTINCSKYQKKTIYNLGSLEEWKQEVVEQDIFNQIGYRPNFDQYFMDIAFSVKQRSNCMKRAVGAVLTMNNKILSTGYNGTPSLMKNCYEGGCHRCNSNASQGVDLSKCVCIHAEANSIMDIGIHKSKGGTLYTTLYPCVFCAKIIMQAKIKRVVYAIDYDNNKSSQFMVGIEICKVHPKHAYVA